MRTTQSTRRARRQAAAARRTARTASHAALDMRHRLSARARRGGGGGSSVVSAGVDELETSVDSVARFASVDSVTPAASVDSDSLALGRGFRRGGGGFRRACRASRSLDRLRRARSPRGIVGRNGLHEVDRCRAAPASFRPRPPVERRDFRPSTSSLRCRIGRFRAGVTPRASACVRCPVLSLSTTSCIATIPISEKASRPIHRRPRISLSRSARRREPVRTACAGPAAAERRGLRAGRAGPETLRGLARAARGRGAGRSARIAGARTWAIGSRQPARDRCSRATSGKRRWRAGSCFTS